MRTRSTVEELEWRCGSLGRRAGFGLHEDGGGQEKVEGDIPVPQRPSGYGCDLT